MKSATLEAKRIWTTTLRRQWAEELAAFPSFSERSRTTCSREAVREALRLAVAATEMGGSYQGMDAQNRFSVANAGSEHTCHEVTS